MSMAVLLTGCGQSTSYRHFEKQRTSSDVKISSLNLNTKNIQMRFEYRSYVKKDLKNISCDLKFNKQESFNIKKSYSIELGAFSTEVLNFHVKGINIDNLLTKLPIINYHINCEMIYNKGSEYVSRTSDLHLVPTEKFLYR